MKELWIRLGVRLNLTDEEVKLLLNDKTPISDREKVVKNVVGELRFEIEGESYVPEGSIDDFNETYGTDYERGEYELCW